MHPSQLCARCSFDEGDQQFAIEFNNGSTEFVDKVVVATGSNKSGYKIAKSFNHKIIDPVPSLFTFTLSKRMLGEGGVFNELSGVSVADATIKLSAPKGGDSKKKRVIEERGPLLITHRGGEV